MNKKIRYLRYFLESNRSEKEHIQDYKTMLVVDRSIRKDIQKICDKYLKRKYYEIAVDTIVNYLGEHDIIEFNDGGKFEKHDVRDLIDNELIYGKSGLEYYNLVYKINISTHEDHNITPKSLYPMILELEKKYNYIDLYYSENNISELTILYDLQNYTDMMSKNFKSMNK